MRIKLSYPTFWQKRNWLANILIPFSWIYICLGAIRKFFSTPRKLPAKVICVGNMSVGGTGKTQLVIWLAGLLKKQGLNFVIISKGYGSKLKSAILVSSDDDPRFVGDEAILLSQYGKVIASPKITDTITLLESIKPDIIIVDDGMQNPCFIKDFTVLTIDPLRGAGNNLIIPAGPLRESLAASIDQADLIFMIGNEAARDQMLLDTIENSGKPCYLGQIKPVNYLGKSKEYIAFTGIGNPEKFFSLLREYEINVIEEISYPDHYAYPVEEIERLKAKTQGNKYSLITTKKDYVKLAGIQGIQFLDIELAFQNELEIIALLNEKIFKKN